MAGVDWQWIDTEYIEDTEIVDDEFTRRREIPGKQQLGGVFLQDIFKLSTKWQLTAAGRLDYIRNYDGSELITDSTGVVRDVAYDDFSETTFNPTVGAVYHANPAISWRASTYRGFRAPTAAELYRGGTSRGGVVNAPNPELGPEHLVGVESGMDFTRKTFGGQITLFWTELQDRVTIVDVQAQGPVGGPIDPCGFVEPDGICRIRENVGAMTAAGIEVDLGYRPFPYWDFSLSYLYEQAEFTDAPDQPELEGLTPRHVPENSFTARVAYSNRRILGATVQGRYIGDRFEDNSNLLPVDSSFIVDVMLSRDLTENVALFLAVENVFDTEYEIRVTSRGLVEIGGPRWVYGGIRLAF
jgi:outer membrane receptor protein involved in Fe transport